jgi:hypothetical protein
VSARLISDRERRARLVARHRLTTAGRAATPADAARDLVALHATDPATVHLSAAARVAQPSVAATERALYDDRELVRILGMRRTMWVVPVELAGIVQTGCTDAIAVRERRTTVKFIEACGVATDGAAWLAEVEAATLALLEARGSALPAELAQEEPRLKVKLSFAQGKSYAGTQSVGSRVLPLLGAQGLAVRGRPSGTWVSTRYRWSSIKAWLPAGIPAITPEEARAELVRAWLARFGPGTITDLKWWTGLTMGETRKAVAAAGAVPVSLDDGGEGLVLPDDVDPVEASAPEAVLLPALDPTTMGWKERGWYLGDHGPRLFDTNGNAGPAIWWDGRVAGGWAVRDGGEVVTRLLDDIGAEGAAAVEAAAGALTTWLDGVRVTPSFRTPLERELTV